MSKEIKTYQLQFSISEVRHSPVNNDNMRFTEHIISPKDMDNAIKRITRLAEEFKTEKM